MIHRLLLVISAVALLPLGARGQHAEEQPIVKVRAVLHDPLQPEASLYYQDQSGTVLPVQFRPQDLTEALSMVSRDGALVLYGKAAIDPQNPRAGVAARAMLPAGVRQAIVVVYPAPAGSETAYRMEVIDDSETSFPFGESRVLSMFDKKVGIQAGEHMVEAQPWKLARVPAVTKVNEFNMAQTDFRYLNKKGVYIVFAERQLQYIGGSRRLFIISAMPNALQPTVTTIVDTRL